MESENLEDGGTGLPSSFALKLALYALPPGWLAKNLVSVSKLRLNAL